MSKNYDEMYFTQQWYCNECDDKGKVGHGFPDARKHREETGHCVTVSQNRDFVLGKLPEDWKELYQQSVRWTKED